MMQWFRDWAARQVDYRTNKDEIHAMRVEFVQRPYSAVVTFADGRPDHQATFTGLFGSTAATDQSGREVARRWAEMVAWSGVWIEDTLIPAHRIQNVRVDPK